MRSRRRVRFVLVLCGGLFLLFAATRVSLGQTLYYAGKTITIVRGGGPGGSGEFQSRALMPYLK
ncbi:MAG TPA: hypothetical protein VMS25_06230, partial [Candidatus Limnocylindrales bacterium]|nr:hypothetical protein [Candidatus Limnocylindrales bacterium]